MADRLNDILRRLARLASAASALALPKVFAGYDDFVAALAPAEPSGALVNSVVVAKDGKKVELMAGDVFAGGVAKEASFQCSINTPSVFKPASYPVLRKVQHVAPFGQCLFFSSILQYSVRANVVRLFFFGGPTAISCLIISSSINAVQCGVWWSNTHVLEKILERFSPTIAYGYAACAVLRKHGRFWIMASLNRGNPAPVRGCADHSVFCNRVAMETAAASDFSTSQVSCSGKRGRSAVALTLPNDFAALTFRKTDDSKPAKSLTSKINHFVHVRSPRIMISHPYSKGK